jgi:hypothetical protein
VICILEREPCPNIFQGVTIPDLALYFEKYFVFATPTKLFGDFNETRYKERSHCADVHIVRGALSIYFSRSSGP